MLTDKAKKELGILSAKIRIATLEEFNHLGFGHVGGAMSIVETLAVLYGKVMQIDPKRPGWKDRDWLVVSKGHAGPAVYATLAIKGFFPMEELKTLNRPGTKLPSHCDRNRTVGIDMTTGSLGQGMSSAIGIALGNRLDGRSNYTYLIIGDGECDEGQIWEGALFAGHRKLDNLIMFVDNNKLQLDGYIKDINNLGNLARKFEEFGWFSQEVDGRDVGKIYEAIEKAKANKNSPSAIILDTVKGQGCVYAEKISENHHMVITETQAQDSIEYAKEKLSKLLAGKGA